MKGLLLFLALTISLAGCTPLEGPGTPATPSPVVEKPVEWEHGYKTSRVIATRYKNSVMGYNIGFTYPLNPNESDRVELSDFMGANGGLIYQSGGYPGAEMFVLFKGVTDKKTADSVLIKILGPLTDLVKSLKRREKT